MDLHIKLFINISSEFSESGIVTTVNRIQNIKFHISKTS
jgi:hypothetical protein